MNTLRKISLFFIGLALLVTLNLNTLVWTTRQTLFDRSVILNWLKEGKVYENIADTAAKIAENNLNKKDETKPAEQQGEGDNNMPDSATLIKAAKAALPPNVLQQNVETVINSAYDWLEGKTDTIVLNLDLSDEKKAFIDALGNEAITRAASLPTCTAQQLNDFDPLSSSCIPSGTNVAAQAEKIKSELSNSKDFLQDTSISSADLTVGKDAEKKLITEQFKAAPKIYKYARQSALAVTLLVLVLGLLVFLLGKTRRGGLKINAWLFGLGGASALLIGSAFNFGDAAIINLTLKDNGTNIGATTATALLSQITATLFKWHLVIGGAYLGVTVICIVSIILMKRGGGSKPPQVDLETPSTAAAQKPQLTPAKPKPVTTKPQAPKPKRTPLIQ